MLKKFSIIALIFISLNSVSQEKEVLDTLNINSSHITLLKGQVISNINKRPLKGAHLFNLTTVIGTITNSQGMFEIESTVNDTLYVSYLGHQSIKLKITNDLLKGNELVIELHEKTEVISEVVVKSHKLIGVLEIDAKNVPKDKYSRIHINGISQTYEVGSRDRNNYRSPIASLAQPIDFVYNLFGKKPKQLRKVKKLRDDDNLRSLMGNKFNRELLMEYLNISAKELNELLNECNYSDYFIRSASDLQLIEAVLLCYENYKAIKKGSTVKDMTKQ